MLTVPIHEFSKHVAEEEEVAIRGWVANIRSSGKVMFLQMRDGSGFVQAVVSQQQVPQSVWEVSQTLTIESSLEATGIVARHPHKDEYELQVRDLVVVQVAEEYPIGKKEHGPDFLLNNRHLWLRSPRQWAIQRIRDAMITAVNLHLHSEGFIKFDSPILTPNACEGTSELFAMEYFDPATKAYLTQSGQLYLEAGMMAFGKVYDFGPVFRAEKSKTRRHLTEFWMMDAEAAFVQHEENMHAQERLIRSVVQYVLEHNSQELALLERDTTILKNIGEPFARMTHKEAVTKLRSLGSDIGDRDDLGADDETLIMKDAQTPLFIELYPAEVKAFYMKRAGDRALDNDLLAPEGYGEIVGGSEREDNYTTLCGRIRAHRLPEAAFAWYADLRKYGSVPHSGYGVGLERLVAWICGVQHVRETIPFPRMISRISP